MSDRIGANHRILSVIAPHSKSGKTLFVTHLLQNISGLGCLKISPAHGHHHDFDNVRVSGPSHGGSGAGSPGYSGSGQCSIGSSVSVPSESGPT